jgi:hypothetical protein
LDDLESGDGLAKLLPSQCVGAGRLVAGDRLTEAMPSNIVARGAEDLGHGPEASLGQPVRGREAAAVS